MDQVDATRGARRSPAIDTWLVLSLSGWVSLIAGVGWVAMPFVGTVGVTMDRLQSPGAPGAKLIDVVLACALLLSFAVPVAAALVPATAWFERLPGRARRSVTGLWVAWVATGIVGLVAALVGQAEGLGFFLIEAAVPSAVGLCVVSLFAGTGALWRKHLGGMPL